MIEKATKRMKDIEKLCEVENFIIKNGRSINEYDNINMLEQPMDDYRYGWYVCEEGFFDQLKSINEFKIYILDVLKKEECEIHKKPKVTNKYNLKFEEYLIKAGAESCPETTINVRWTSAYQSYFSAGDEAEPYCIECDMKLEDGWNYCPDCGIKLIWNVEDVNMDANKKVFKFKYQNWKGEISDRAVIPIEIWFGEVEFHEGEQWLLRAFDLDKQAERNFAMRDVLEIYK